MRQLPPLAAVRAFEAAARHGNFTRAAAELGMTQAAVSYQIRLLEGRVGAPLFVRAARGVSLSEAGRRLAPAIMGAFDAIGEAFAGLREATAGVLTISTFTSVAALWLAPRLGAFQLANPGLAVRLDTESRVVDLTREEVDVGVRTGWGGWPGVRAHRLFRWTFTPMAAPSLLERWGPVREPADLLRLPALDYDDPWRAAWLAQAGVAAEPGEPRPGVRFDSQVGEGTAAMAGGGTVMLTPMLWRPELAAGRLVQLFDLVGVSETTVWLVYAEHARGTPKVRAFREWLLGEVAREAAGDTTGAFECSRHENGRPREEPAAS